MATKHRINQCGLSCNSRAKCDNMVESAIVNFRICNYEDGHCDYQIDSLVTIEENTEKVSE